MNFKTRTINSIIKKAKDKIELNDKLPAGYIWKQWSLYKTELDTIIENATDKDSIALHQSSGKFNLHKLQDMLRHLQKKVKEEVRNCLHHPSELEYYEGVEHEVVA